MNERNKKIKENHAKNLNCLLTNQVALSEEICCFKMLEDLATNNEEIDIKMITHVTYNLLKHTETKVLITFDVGLPISLFLLFHCFKILKTEQLLMIKER